MHYKTDETCYYTNQNAHDKAMNFNKKTENKLSEMNLKITLFSNRIGLTIINKYWRSNLSSSDFIGHNIILNCIKKKFVNH